MRRVMGVLAIAATLAVTAACSSAPAAPPATPAKTAPTAAPAAKPTDKPAAKPTAAQAAAKAPSSAAALKVEAAKPAANAQPSSVVSRPVNAAGQFSPSNSLILYGDLAFFAGKDNPESCILKSRYKRGEAVGFRMTALDPSTGKFVDNADLVVTITHGGKTEKLPMRYRGTGENARPGFWTAKWVVPDDAPVGVVKYVVEARDKNGRSALWSPFNIETSMLTVVE